MVAMNEGIVHAADRSGNSDATVSQKVPVKSRKSECAKPRTKRMTAPSRKEKEEWKR